MSESLIGKFLNVGRVRVVFLSAGLLVLTAAAIVFLLFLFNLPIDFDLCAEGKMWGCTGILKYQLLPLLIALSAVYYLYVGIKGIETSVIVFLSAVIQLIAALVTVLFVPAAISGCVLAPDPFCFVFGIPFMLIGFILSIAGFVVFIIGFIGRLLKVR